MKTGEDERSHWNPWYGCHKCSAGCKNCYVYLIAEKNGKPVPSNVIRAKDKMFYGPRMTKRGKFPSKFPEGGEFFAVMSSDFFIEEADKWRDEAWETIKKRKDAMFYIFTKRPERILQCLPSDWGSGYENIIICCTVENQEQADQRVKLFKELPLPLKAINCEPLLDEIDFRGELGDWCLQVSVGGESGPVEKTRTCDLAWVRKIYRQCKEAGVPMRFKQTGTNFKIKNCHYVFKTRAKQKREAARLKINYLGPDIKFHK